MGNTEKIRGEISVGYFADKKSPKRIKRHFPKIKLIAILRNPIEMAYSIYHHLCALVHTEMPNNFETALEQEKYKKLRLHWGLYYKQLSYYLKFFDQDQFCIVLLDDVKKNPKKVVQKVYSFLNIESDFQPSGLKQKENQAVRPNSKILQKVGFKMLKATEKLGFKSVHNELSRNRFLKFIYNRYNLKKHKYPPLKLQTREKLLKYYIKDIKKLEDLLDRSLHNWLE